MVSGPAMVSLLKLLASMSCEVPALELPVIVSPTEPTTVMLSPPEEDPWIRMDS
jgi:hypothetical protein